MKITIYELLGLIKDKKIKNGTRIKCSDFPVTYIFKNGTLGFYSEDVFYELTLRDILENIDYANYEIIEEVEDKEYEDIEELKIDYDDGDIALDGVYLTSNHSEILANKLNALIRNQKYILERLDK